MSNDERSEVILKEEEEGMTPLLARHQPHDAYCLVYGIFFMLGVGSLLPWNFFITAKHYWLYKLNRSSLASNQELHTDFSNYFESYLAIASTVPSVLCLFFSYLLVNKLSSDVRILLSLVVILLVFLVTTILVKMDVSDCQAMGGTLSAVASIVDLAAASDVTSSALAYFLTADIFILVCIMMYLLLPKLAYFRYYLPSSSTGTSTTSDLFLSTPESNSNPTVFSVSPLNHIMEKMWTLSIYVFWVFFISITIFPAISSGIQSVDKGSSSPWSTTYFVPLTSFLLYNVADFSGRLMTIWLQVPGPTSPVMPILVFCRSALVPLFMFCNYQPRYHLHQVLFAHDIFPAVFVCLLGLSNGYLGTLTMIYGPKVVPRDLAEPAGVIMSFFLALGLAAGSAFSIVLVYIL
ncbi:Equilibrative nucleoside transporter 3 [Bagarius yarrelli]|uniref:Equilibrative nucleoside transporter 3 n=1 Tax=Bagarius yarrelli TaxID=175774 RepID=A0A556VV65_BAGYA|nr:Equilibrative nucleoside transporter 3 [Bagarius yarrelli]